MAQIYYEKAIKERAYFEVFIRELPNNWGFFIMSGLSEIYSYIKSFEFNSEDIVFLKKTNLFLKSFITFLSHYRPKVKIRALPEGSIFFPNEPILEIEGSLIDGQILESYVLNILGFSILESTLATRIAYAAKGIPVIDFGLRRAQGPVASLRAARGAQLAGFTGTSNVAAAKQLQFRPAGTMAHSFIQVHKSEEEAFIEYINLYGKDSILLVDTYNPVEGIKKAATVARYFKEKNIQINGIRIDSGDFTSLSRYARRHFNEQGVPFLKIFISGGLDEYVIKDLIQERAEIDGIGIGTRFITSHHSPDLDIAYKLVQYGNKPVSKKSPHKETQPGRKSIIRRKKNFFECDSVVPYPQKNDLLSPFDNEENIDIIKQRVSSELSYLKDSYKTISNPDTYPVNFQLQTDPSS